MRVEIWDSNAYSHAIDSADLDLIGRWFAEKAKLILSADCRYNHPAQLHIWPSTLDESKLIPEWHQHTRFTQESILSLAEHLTRISADYPHEDDLAV